MEPRHTPKSRDLLTIGQAAAALGVHVDTLRRWTQSGQVDAIRTIGGHRRYRLADIERLRDVA